ncbi:MAG: acyltransferase [Roseburia sp.]|nr:acyltransferase [Roseburia sp.]
MSRQQSTMCKGMAILIMFFHHLFYDLNFWTQYDVIADPFTNKQLASLASVGKICVAVFVFLSGYGTARSFHERSIGNPKQIGENTISRLVKIMMHYWYIYIVAFFVALFAGTTSIPELYNSGDRNHWLKNMLVDFLGMPLLTQTPTLCTTWWYMSYAVMLIVVLPVVISIVKKYGAIVSLGGVIIILPFMGITGDTAFGHWMLSAVLGVVCADYNIFEYLNRKLSGHRLYIALILNLVLIAIFALGRIKIREYVIIDATMALLCCFFVIFGLSKIKLIKDILLIYGRHEFTIFLTHTFIRKYYFADFTYSWKYPIVMWIMLAITSLLLAMVLDWGEKLVKFDKLTRYVQNKCIKMHNEMWRAKEV